MGRRIISDSWDQNIIKHHQPRISVILSPDQTSATLSSSSFCTMPLILRSPQHPTVVMVTGFPTICQVAAIYVVWVAVWVTCGLGVAAFISFIHLHFMKPEGIASNRSAMLSAKSTSRRKNPCTAIQAIETPTKKGTSKKWKVLQGAQGHSTSSKWQQQGAKQRELRAIHHNRLTRSPTQEAKSEAVPENFRRHSRSSYEDGVTLKFTRRMSAMP